MEIGEVWFTWGIGQTAESKADLNRLAEIRKERERAKERRTQELKKKEELKVSSWSVMIFVWRNINRMFASSLFDELTLGLGASVTASRSDEAESAESGREEEGAEEARIGSNGSELKGMDL